MTLLDPASAPLSARDAAITPEQIRAARAALGWSSEVLAQRAGLSRRTVWSAETGKTPDLAEQRSTLAIKLTLEAAGIEFIGGPGNGPGIRLRPDRPSA